MVCVSSHGQWLVLCHWRSRTPSRSTDPYHGVRRRLSFAVPCRRSFRLETPTGNLLGFDAAAGWRSRAARPPAPNGRAFGGSRRGTHAVRSAAGPDRRGARRRSALVVELGEVGGEGAVVELPGRRGRRRDVGVSSRQRRGDRNLDAVDGRVRHDQDEEGRRPGVAAGGRPRWAAPGTRGDHVGDPRAPWSAVPAMTIASSPLVITADHRAAYWGRTHRPPPAGAGSVVNRELAG